MIPVEFICLANSYKPGGRCVAGLRTDGKGWIRPVSGSANGAGKWKLVARPAPEAAIPILRANLWTEDILFGNPGDRVGADEIRTCEHSLALLDPDDVQWKITVAFAKRQTRALFKLGQRHYNLPVTDPCCKNRLERLDCGIYSGTEAGLDDSDRLLFTASLGEVMNGYYFKLIAGVTVLPASWRTLL